MTQYLTAEALSCSRREDPFFLEGSEGIGIQHFGPLVAVVASCIATREDVPEGGAHLARCRRSGQELGLLPSRIFEGLRVKALGKWLGDRVPSHIEVAEAQLTTGSVACEEVAGTLHTLHKDLG